MSKLIVFGELYGNSLYRLVDLKDFDTVVFMGNLLIPRAQATSTLSKAKATLSEFDRILALKRHDPQKYILIPGYHDLAILFPKTHPDSTSIEYHAPYQVRTEMHTKLRENANLYSFIFQIGTTLFSPAGMTDKWLKENMALLFSRGFGNMGTNLGKFLHYGMFIREIRDALLCDAADAEFGSMLSQNLLLKYPTGPCNTDARTFESDGHKQLINGIEQIVCAEPVKKLKVIGTPKKNAMYNVNFMGEFSDTNVDTVPKYLTIKY